MKRFEVLNEEDAAAILRMAMNGQSEAGQVSRTELIRSASELGISEEAVLAAESEYREKKQYERDRVDYKRKRRRDAWGSFSGTIGIIAFLLFIDFMGDRNIDWAYWPAGIMAFFMIKEVLQLLGAQGNFEQDFQKWRDKKHRKENAFAGVKAPAATNDLRQVLDDISLTVDVTSDKVQAIKELRERTGLGLEESKEAVDEYVKGYA